MTAQDVPLTSEQEKAVELVMLDLWAACEHRSKPGAETPCGECSKAILRALVREVVQPVEKEREYWRGTAKGLGIACFESEKAGAALAAKGLDGDGPCSSCGTRNNVVWFTESVFWNAVIRAEGSRWQHNEPILCISCFAIAADEMGFTPTGWRLLPEWPWSQRTPKAPEGR